MFAVYFRVRYLKKWNIILKDLKEFLTFDHFTVRFPFFPIRDVRG